QEDARYTRLATPRSVVLNQICHVRPILYCVLQSGLTSRQLQNFRLLRLVGVLSPPVDLELGCHLAAHLAFGQHAFDGVLDNLLRPARHEAHKGLFPQAARKTGVTTIDLLLTLEPGET